MLKAKSKDFYVYLHRRATDGKVFYVGKGHGKRAYDKFNGRNKHWKNVALKHGYTVEFYATGLQEWCAFELEKELIAHYGRENLCNYSDGGEGPSGSKHSSEANAKKSIVVKNIWENNDVRKEQMSKLHKQQWSIEEDRQKRISSMIAAHKKDSEIKRKKTKMRESYAKPVICIDTQEKFKTIAYAVDWLKSLGMNKAVSCSISYVCSGKRKTAYGYTWRYLVE